MGLMVMESKYNQEEIEFFKNVYINSIRCGHNNATALHHASQAILDLRTKSFQVDLSPEEIRDIKSVKSGSIKKTALEIIKESENG